MTITILGCGTSVGTPMIGMQHLPQFRNPKNRRLRASCLVEPFGRGGPAILIDTSPDLRQQVLHYFPKKNPRLDAVLITHTHADHCHGIDDIRPFNFYQKQRIPFYSDDYCLKQIQERFPYIFADIKYEGGGIPRITLNPVSPETPFRLTACEDKRLHDLEVIPLRLHHGSSFSLGFRIGGFAYLTDVSQIPQAALDQLHDLDLLVLDCLRPQPHTTHLTVSQALHYAGAIKARRTVFTHMGHELRYESFKKELPKGILPAYDGLRLEI